MATKKVLLATALVAGSSLRARVSNGIGAVHNNDRTLIVVSERPRVGDSLDLDEATRVAFPNAHRWDYLLSIPDISQIVGIEPHSATDREIRVVIAKRRHAIDYLRDHLPQKHRVEKWFWISHGSVGFTKMERARRLLDQNGISFEGRTLKSFG